MRDNQKQKVYDAEHQFCRMLDTVELDGTIDFFGSRVAVDTDRKFTRVADVQRFVDAIVTSLLPEHRSVVPTVVVRKGEAKAVYRSSDNTICVPEAKWALRESVILHEMAHWLVAHSLDRSTCEAHGPEFAGIFVDLVSRVMGSGSAMVLSACLDGSGVRMVSTPQSVSV